jgi:hypothetical protein
MNIDNKEVHMTTNIPSNDFENKYDSSIVSTKKFKLA